ncbi:Rrf2 family transcriptional regulator [Streptomyces sp. NPDC102473]|uniref:Rrf2 family transcriptional regulator n=1 Tax=Streptomyces sp. NPDC102473 TaxID=3366180 RepID=UPI0037FD5F57
MLTSATGPRGGFRLARGPRTITLLDVVTATEGASGSLPLPGGPQEGAGRPRPPAPPAEPDGGGNDNSFTPIDDHSRRGMALARAPCEPAVRRSGGRSATTTVGAGCRMRAGEWFSSYDGLTPDRAGPWGSGRRPA